MNQPINATGYENIYQLLGRSGVGSPAGLRKNFVQQKISVNGEITQMDSTVECGDEVVLDGLGYRIEKSNHSGHLRVIPTAPDTGRIEGRRLIQCGYHKCLTNYFRKVLRRTSRNPIANVGEYQHFYHRLDEFYRRCHFYSISSISGHAIDLDRFEDARVTRFIRDPRDLLVSGYFYHKRSAESWCDLVDPEDSDWEIVNGKVPEQLPRGSSLSKYLNSVSVEEGLLAELDFRQNHYDSMMAWPDEDARIKLFRYEDLVGNEAEIYNQMFEFYELSTASKFVGRFYARRYRAAKRQATLKHIRNANSGQWREHFTPEVTRQFNQRYEALLEKQDYLPA